AVAVVAGEGGALACARSLGVGRPDGEIRAIDAGEDLVIEVGLEGDIGWSGVARAAGADGAGGCVVGRDAAVCAVDDGVSGSITSVLVDDLVGVERHDRSDSSEEE